MIPKRIIPVLLINNGDLIKTKKFEFYKYVGDPLNSIKIFNDKEVDEIIVIDIGCNNTSPNFEMISVLNNESFMPFTYGGGIKSLDDVDRIFSMGVEKISIQKAAFDNINLIEKIANKFGSQSIVLSIDYFLNDQNKYQMKYLNNNFLDQDQIKLFLNDYINAGIGEIMINSIYRDGMKEGQDLEFINFISKLTSAPLISVGGISSFEDIKNSFIAGADAVAVGSFFIFYGKFDAILITYPTSSEISKILK